MQRIPKGETRRHTSIVTVAVLGDTDTPTSQLDVNDVEFDVYRASGPGGQHRNTSDTAVRATHRPTGIVVCATSSRSQGTNRADALAELERRLAEQAEAEHGAERNRERTGQIGSGDRSEVTWTWNAQRSTVTHHPSNTKWRWKDVTRGKV